MIAIDSAREYACRIQCGNNVKQIALALIEYEHEHRTYPPAFTVDGNGRPMHSWRVLILPYLDEADLYKQFHLDEPWNSEHNEPLIADMPSVFAEPRGRAASDGYTRYVVPVGKDTVFQGDKGVRPAEITDGMSNTIMIVEVGPDKAVEWTKPGDMEFDPKQPLAGFGALGADGFYAAFCDGSVHRIGKSIDAETLRRLIIRNDGQPIDPTKF
jgi:hypothetical protein